MRQKINAYILMTILICTMLVPMGTVYAEDTDFSIKTPSTVKHGETFTIEVTGTDVSNLYAFEIELSFERQKLELVSAKSGISSGIEFGPKKEDTKIYHSFTKIGDVSEEKGNISLATFTFQALESGQTNIGLVSVKITGKYGKSKVYDVHKKALITIGSSETNSGGSSSTTKDPVNSNEPIIEETIYFSDVQEHWAKNTIMKMAAKKIINGMPNGTFNPDGSITRAQFATMIVNALDLETSNYEAEFTDVKQGAWYYDAVTTAFKAGLVSGVGDNKFDPEANITREQMAVMVMRAYDYMTENEYEKMQPSSQVNFTDEANISSWAKKAVFTANDMKIIMGMPDGSFAPLATATRAEAATMLYRLLVQNGLL